MRRVNKNDFPNPDSDKMFIIVLAYVEGNKNAMPPIGKRTEELSTIKKMFEELKKITKTHL
ncbi:MAG: hypothetical protein WKG06_34230 [Segetibacter sp.]